MSRERKTDPEAWQHTSTNRNIIKGYIDDHIKQRCESSLEAAKTVEKLCKILEVQEEIFWPQDKRLKSFMITTRKSSDDPLTFLSELCKKAKFCRISQVLDGVQCNKCHMEVKVDPNDEQATEKICTSSLFRRDQPQQDLCLNN